MKKYLKKYLENKYGSPVQFPRECVEKVHLNALLTRNSHDRDKEYSRYEAITTIIIDERHFRHCGFEMTPTSIIHYNSFLEELFKDKMRFYIMMHLRPMGQLNFVIERFRNEFNFCDDDLPFDTIKKDFQRFTKRNNINFREWVGRKKVVSDVPHEFNLSKM